MTIPKGVYNKFKDNLKEFSSHIHKEKDETKEAFRLLIDSIENGTELTQEEKHEIGEQLKDVLKILGLVGIFILPGGTVFLILAKFFKLNKYIMPSSFEEIETKK